MDNSKGNRSQLCKFEKTAQVMLKLHPSINKSKPNDKEEIVTSLVLQ